MRGGAHEPLSEADIVAKFYDNARFGGWPREKAAAFAEALDRIAAGGPTDLSIARGVI
jgi:hypothetical protein